MNKEQLIQAIEAKKAEIAEKTSNIKELQDLLSDIEVNPDQYADLDSMYDDFLDEIYSEACEALPVSVSGSTLIREIDPVMYRCGFSDYVSNFNYSDLDIYQTTESDLDSLESDLSDLESELEDCEQTLEFLEDEEISSIKYSFDF